jgi:UDP-glucose 4-epimerase
VELMLRNLHQLLGWSFVALRYFNASGDDPEGLIGESHTPETHLIPLVLQAALGQGPGLSILGDDYDTPDGTCIRDYIHVVDLANAHCLAVDKLLSSTPLAEAVNLGTTHGASVKEVIGLAQEVTGREIPYSVKPRRPGDPAVLVANAEKARTWLGWEPQYTLRDAIATAWAWEQKRHY